MIKGKKGNVVIGDICIFLVIIVLLLYISTYLVNILMIFIQYQKLNSIVTKYSFIIQEFGSLTLTEEENLYNDLVKEKFDIQNLKVTIPEETKNYGELICFSIEYNTVINKFIYNKMSNDFVKLKVDKFFYKNK